MDADKKCSHCGRYYRGEGFEGLCTEYCHFTKMHPPKPRKKPYKNKYLIKPEKPYVNPREANIKRINQRWLERAGPPVCRPKHSVNMLMCKDMGYGESGWLKKFNSVRG